MFRVYEWQLTCTVLSKKFSNFSCMSGARFICQNSLNLLKIQSRFCLLFRSSSNIFSLLLIVRWKLLCEPVCHIINGSGSISQLFDGHSHIAHFAHSDVLLSLIVFAVRGLSCFSPFLRIRRRLHSVLQSAPCRYRLNRSWTSSCVSPPFLWWLRLVVSCLTPSTGDEWRIWAEKSWKNIKSLRASVDGCQEGWIATYAM